MAAGVFMRGVDWGCVTPRGIAAGVTDVLAGGILPSIDKAVDILASVASDIFAALAAIILPPLSCGR